MPIRRLGPRPPEGPSGPTTPAVVVIGAGFAGLAAVDILVAGGARVTLVDERAYHTFQPLLYEVATAGLNPGDVAFAARALVRIHPGLEFRRGRVVGTDWGRRLVHLADGGELAYDYLLVATGARTNFFGVRGAREHAHPIYTLEDARTVRDRLFAALEDAENTARRQAGGGPAGASRGADLGVTVVGGGATGVEMAGALAELLDLELGRDYPLLTPGRARVVLVEARTELLEPFAPRLRRYAARELRARGVDLRLGDSVVAVGPDRIVLGGGDVVPCALVVWAAGVTAGELAESLRLEQGPNGRLIVRPELNLAEHPEVFVAGDVAALRAPDGSWTPQLAQPAIQSGAHAARQILRHASGQPLEQFRYADKGSMATIGRRAAVAQLPWGLQLTGTPAWLAWLGLHLVTLLGARNRFSVLLNWSWRYLSWRRGPRVIVGG